MFQLIDFIIVRPIVNILFVIYNFVGDFGLAIILFTIIVKICMWPLVKRQLHQTKLMRKIQPELTEIKKNCKGNRQMESLQTMDLYKRNNIKPFRSFITVLIQLPIFIALYTAIRVMVIPTPSDNVALRAYEPVHNLPRISEIIEMQEPYLQDTANGYEFKPRLFGIVDLNASAANIFRGEISPSVIIVLLFALAAAFLQYWSSRQQMPSGNSKKSKTFRQLMKEAAAGDGSEPDQAEINALATRQMGFMMPLMMFFIMFYLPGALVFYYLLSSGINVIQQHIVLNKADKEMEISTDKAILKELKKVQEAEIIENKKTGTKITRISAKDTKKSKSTKTKIANSKSTNKKRRK
ncbi:YidC/Oxa1 family membrane protein insertase [Candidatus Saccharibacteria bacterium]|nr:YidC/Oxa1 family membrane protein insertase [Candidatus Saccharibacteria bacterium]